MNLIGDVAIPIVAILVPTALAIGLARSERKAAAKDRSEARRYAEQVRAAEGAEIALDAMTDLVEAGYTDDIRLAASIRIRAARKLAKIHTYLGASNEYLSNWIIKELGIVADGLENRDQLNLPVLLEQIVWRSASFTNTLIDWQAGEKSLAWFESAVHTSLADSECPQLALLP